MYKKISAFALVLALSLTACSGGQDSNENPQSTETEGGVTAAEQSAQNESPTAGLKS